MTEMTDMTEMTEMAEMAEMTEMTIQTAGPCPSFTHTIPPWFEPAVKTHASFKSFTSKVRTKIRT